MPLQPLRFIHASQLLIDHQLRDLGTLSPEVRPIALTATLRSFERVVDACIARNADFLLLTGGTFDERDRSLRSRVAIRHAFERLQDSGIQIFIVPGGQDSSTAWREFGDLGDHVTVFDPSVDEPTAIMHENAVVATIESCDPTRQPRSTEDSVFRRERHHPLRIGIVPSSSKLQSGQFVEEPFGQFDIDYLAVPAPCRRLSMTQGDRLVHCPGPATPLTKRDIGPHGCTLVIVQETGQITHELLETSPVRRERFDIEITPHTTWDELIGLMRERLDSIDHMDVPPLVLADWNLRGDGPLFDSLADELAESELFELLTIDQSLSTHHHIEHRLKRLVVASTFFELGHDYGAERPGDDELTILESTSGSGFFGKAFFQRHESESSFVRSVLERTRKQKPSNDSWLVKLENLAGRIDEAAVAARTRQLGTDWFIRVDSAGN